MRRELLLAVALGAATVLAGCGSDETSGAAGDLDELTGEVTMWFPPIVDGAEEQAYWDGVVAAFNEEYPDVTVDVEIIPWEGRDEKLRTAIAGRSTPDVTYVLPRDVSAFGSQEVLADVGDVLGGDASDFLPNALEAMTYDGTLYAVPTLVGIHSTIYVKDVFDAVGIAPEDYPTTWDEVREVAPILKAAGYYVTQYDAAPTMTLNATFYPLLWSAGGTILNEDGTAAAINGPEGLRALEFLIWLVDNEYTPKDALTAELPVETSPMAAGKVAMHFSRVYSNMERLGMGDYELIVGEPLADAESATYGNVGGYALFAGSADSAAAKEWIRFITQPDQLREFLPERQQYSPRKSVSGLYEEGSNEALIESQLDLGRAEPTIPEAGEIMELIKPHLQAALMGQVEPQAALDAAAADIDSALG